MTVTSLIILTGIGFSIFHIYLIVLLIIYGICFSVSNTYYQLPKNYNFLFTLFCWGYSIPCMIACLDIFGTLYMFICGSAICFVGAAAAFRNDYLTSEVHTKAATIAVIASQLSIIFDFHQYIISAVTVTLFITLSIICKYIKWLDKVWMYIAEVIIVESLFLCIILKLINIYYGKS